jgi:short-subunit dehydrogenase
MTWLTESICDQWSQLPIFLGPGAAAGKTYIVTGANVGIGLETSKHLVKASASRVILAVRNIEAGERARVEIEKETGIKGVAEVWHLDLSSFASVKAFATKADRELERLDVLVNNAALAYDQFTLSEGLELSVKVNVASTFLLGALLFPKLSKSGRLHGFQPRLVFVVTALAFAAKDELYNLQNDKSIFESLNEEKRAKMSTRWVIVLTLFTRSWEIADVELSLVQVCSYETHADPCGPSTSCHFSGGADKRHHHDGRSGAVQD